MSSNQTRAALLQPQNPQSREVGPIVLFASMEKFEGFGGTPACIRERMAGALQRHIKVNDGEIFLRDPLAAGAGGAVLLADLNIAGTSRLAAVKISHPYLLRETNAKPVPSGLRHYADEPMKPRLQHYLESMALRQASKFDSQHATAPEFYGSWEIQHPQHRHHGLRVTAMEFIQGTSLREYIETQLRLPAGVPRTLRALSRVAENIANLHKAGLYCPDPYAGNFMIKELPGHKIASRIVDLGGCVPKVGGRLLCPAGFSDSPLYKCLVENREEAERISLTSLAPGSAKTGSLLRDLASGCSEFQRSDTLIRALHTFNPPASNPDQLLAQAADLNTLVKNM